MVEKLFVLGVWKLRKESGCLCAKEGPEAVPAYIQHIFYVAIFILCEVMKTDTDMTQYSTTAK